jgi:hypothetical protein
LIGLANFVSANWSWITGTVLTLAIAAASEENYRARRQFSGRWNFRLHWYEEWRGELLGDCPSQGELLSTGKVHLNYESRPFKQYSGIGHFDLEAGGQSQRRVAAELVGIRIGIRRQGWSFGYYLLRCDLFTVFVQTEKCPFIPPRREYRVEFDRSDQSLLKAWTYYQGKKVGWVRGDR